MSNSHGAEVDIQNAYVNVARHGVASTLLPGSLVVIAATA